MAEPVKKQHIDFITNALTALATNVSVKAKLNLTDLHVVSEDFFADLLNLMYDLHLHNANAKAMNAEGIDLIDEDARIIVQVSGTCSKHKIDHSLAELKETYSGFHFIFVPIIVGSAKRQQKNKYSAPYEIVFEPSKDIRDVSFLIKELVMGTCKHKTGEVADFLRKELKYVMIDNERLDSGLEFVIKELAKDGSDDPNFDAKDFQIDAKIAFNGLNEGQDIIREYSNQYNKVKHIYDEYSKQGQIKSKAVLQKLHKLYLVWKNTLAGDALFFKIEKEIISSVCANSMPDGFTLEELEMCVDILMVHAFMDCKIFEKPV